MGKKTALAILVVLFMTALSSLPLATSALADTGGPGVGPLASALQSR